MQGTFFRTLIRFSSKLFYLYIYIYIGGYDRIARHGIVLPEKSRNRRKSYLQIEYSGNTCTVVHVF